jgi:hypothetical protein
VLSYLLTLNIIKDENKVIKNKNKGKESSFKN